MATFIALLLPGLAVWFAMRGCGHIRVADSRVLATTLAVCVGIGLSAVSTFWLVMAGAGMGRGFLLADLFLWVGVCVGSWLWRRRLQQHPECEAGIASRPPPQVRPDAPWWLKGTFGVIAALTAVAVVAGYMTSPHGDWDAWAIWNQKARFLLRAPEHWVDVLTIGWSQPGHPLLVPASVARLWAYAGRETTVAPGIVGIVFGTAIVTVVVTALGIGRRRAWIAGAILLAPGIFIEQWTAQQADIPFAFFMVSSLAVLGHARIAAPRDGPPLLFLSGALASLAAWTKNEGMVLAAVTFGLAVAIAVRNRRPRDLLWWVAGSGPAMVTIAWFKLRVAPESPYYLPDTPLLATLLERISLSEHRSLIDAALWERLVGWGTPVPGAILVLSVAAVGLALTRAGAVARAGLLALGVMLAGYYGVYLLTSVDVAWLIATTFNRLLVQLWPSLVLAAFFTTDTATLYMRTTTSQLHAYPPE